MLVLVLVLPGRRRADCQGLDSRLATKGRGGPGRAEQEGGAGPGLDRYVLGWEPAEEVGLSED